MSNPSKHAEMDDGNKAATGDDTQGVGTPQGSSGAVQKSNLVFAECYFTLDTVLGTLGYVDKTLFIKEFFDTKRLILITAPRRFGKTTNMDMLKQFLLGNRQLFITEDYQCKLYLQHKEWFENNCNKHPVIHADFKILRSTNYDHFLKAFRKLLCDSFREHEYLVERRDNGDYVWKSENLQKKGKSVDMFMQYFDECQSKGLDEEDIKHGFKYLSEVLHIHYGEKVFILIDEYDAFVIYALTSSKVSCDDTESMVELLRLVMGETLKSNIHLERTLINACVRLAGGASSGDAEGVIHYCEFLNENEQFTQFYGFTKEDVDMLMEKPEFKELMEGKREEIDSWYGGYKSVSGDDVYNAWSILNVLDQEFNQKNVMEAKRKMKRVSFSKTYWVDTGYVKNMTTLFENKDIREHIERLINGEEVEIATPISFTLENIVTLKDVMELGNLSPDSKDVNVFLRFLADSGYLNSSPKYENSYRKVSKRSMVSVPNLEMKTELIRHCYNADVWGKKYCLDRNHIAQYQKALMNVVANATDASFSKLAESVTMLFSGRAKVPDNEYALHCLLFAFAYDVQNLDVGTEVHVKRMKKGRVRLPRIDILIVCGVKGITIELKVNPGRPEDALAQIFETGYDNIFQEDGYMKVTQKIYAGVSFYTGEKKTAIWYSSTDMDHAQSVSYSITEQPVKQD